MSASLRTATAFLALFALALPAGASAAQVLVDCCEGHCPDHAPAPDHASGHGTPDPSSVPLETPAPGGEVCCAAPAVPVSGTPVVVPAPDRAPEAALLTALVVGPRHAAPRTLELPARPPPGPALRSHLALSVLLI